MNGRRPAGRELCAPLRRGRCLHTSARVWSAVYDAAARAGPLHAVSNIYRNVKLILKNLTKAGIHSNVKIFFIKNLETRVTYCNFFSGAIRWC